MQRFLFDLNPNPILIFDPKTLRILKTNKAFQKKYGYEEISELTLEDIRPQEDIEYLHEVLEGLETEGVSSAEVVRHQSKNGEIFYVNISTHEYTHEGRDARIVLIHDVTERVKAEKKAQKAFEELNHHVNESPLAMVKWDEEFRVTEWSKRAREIVGFSEEEVIGKPPRFLSFYREKDRALVEKNVRGMVSGEREKAKLDIKMYTKDGKLIDLRVHGSALRDDRGDLISVLTFLEDITEQRKTELRYQRLFENANDGIFLTHTRDNTFVECNEKICEIFECNREDILGKTPIDFSPEFQPDGQRSDEKAIEKINKALKEGPQVFEWKHEKLDGTPIATEVSLNKLELGDEVYIQAIIRDLTEQKKAQEKLRKSEEMFRKLFLKAPGAMIMVDKNNKVQMVNQSFENLFGYSEDELIGEDIDEVLVQKGQKAVTPKDFKDGIFYEDVTRYTKDGKPLDLMLGSIPVDLDDEAIAGFGVYVDITEQKENERKLKQSLRENRVLLEEIHHRVKNNLAIISGFLQLQSFEIEDEKIKEVLNDSQLRIQSIAIVHELLYKSENFIDISFETYIKRLIKTMKKTLPLDHQHIDIEIDAADVSLDINQAIPCAILINELVTNSYKHAFEEKETGTIRVELYEDSEQIFVEVRDDGKGLPEEFAVEEQSSIGMNLILTLTSQLNGSLEASSPDGSCFKVSFAKPAKEGQSKLENFKES